jgi:iron complex outermembrane receptor protein
MIALNEDSDIAGFKMKLKTFDYDAKYHLPKSKLESILGIQGMHQTNVNSGEEYLTRCYY